MKKIFGLALILLSFNAVCQPPGYQKRLVREEVISFITDSTQHIPRYCGTPSGVRVGGYVADGAIAMDTCNNRFYIYSGGAWVRVANYSEITGGGARFGVTGEDDNITEHRIVNFHGIYNMEFDSVNQFLIKRSNINRVSVNGSTTSFGSADGSNSFTIYNDSSATDKRISYNTNINGSLTVNSLVTKGYVDSARVANIPTLQQVMTSGNTTTVSYSSTSTIITNNSSGHILNAVDGTLRAAISKTSSNGSGFLELVNSSSPDFSAQLYTPSLSGNRLYYLPTTVNGSGTDTLLSKQDLRNAGGGGGGETNTASNVGGGLGIFNAKVGVDLQFKSLNTSDFDTASNLISIDYTNGPQRKLVADRSVTITSGGGNADTARFVNDIENPGIWKVYGTDTSGTNSAKGWKQAAVLSLTNLENKHFLNYNYSTGEWNNTKYFQEMRFITGDSLYVLNGDSTITDTSFFSRKLNVFRESDLQYKDDTYSGYEITDSTLTFHPPLYTGERIVIQIYDTMHWNSITSSENIYTGGGSCSLSYVSFTTTGDITESPTGTWSTTAGGAAKGFSTTSLPSGTAGNFQIQNTDAAADANPIGLDDDASNTEDYTNWECTVYRNSGTYWRVDNGGSATNTGITASTGDWVRFDVTAGGVIKAQYSTNSGGSWSDIFTYTATGNHTLYAKTHLVVAGKKIIEAKVCGFE